MIIRRVHGNSMLPSLKPGSIVIGIKPRKIKPGQIVVFNHEGIEKIKRATSVTKEGVFVEGDNKLESTDSRSFGYIKKESIKYIIISNLITR